MVCESVKCMCVLLQVLLQVACACGLCFESDHFQQIVLSLNK